MYKAITVFDLDNTLLTVHKRVSQENRVVLDKLRANNVLPVIGTGRDLFAIQDVVRAGRFNAVISANGAHLIFERQELQETTVATQTLDRITDWAQRHVIPVAYSNAHDIAISRIDSVVQANYTAINRCLPRIDTTFYRHNQINKLLLFLPLAKRDISTIKMLTTRFPELAFYRNSDSCIDIAPKGISKAAGIAAFKSLMHLQQVPVFAFGDGNNDIEMLEKATVGVAMGNASKSVQAHADYVTSRFDNHGITQALQYYDLI